MGIIERKKREKEERRALIVEATKRLILERGVDSPSMQDIADATELSKATLYLYFESKEQILWEILDDAAATFSAYVERNVARAKSGIEALRALWGSFLTIFGESTDIFVLIGIANYVDSALPLVGNDEPPAERGALWRMKDLIAKVLSRGVADGTLDPATDPDKMARVAVLIARALIDNIARLPRKERSGRHLEEELRSTFELMLRGLAAAGTDRSLLLLSPAL